jgi:predicted transcriptional regulator
MAGVQSSVDKISNSDISDGPNTHIKENLRMATLVEIAGQLVASHAANSNLTTDELLLELAKVHAVLKNLDAGHAVEGETEAKPAMTLKEAFKKNEVVCMVCGKGGFKTLARHLSTAHQMKPGAYKKQFGIPSKQSLSAQSYSEARRAMALDRGLGDVLAKARQVRMGNIEAKKAAPVKAVKAKAPAAVKAPAAAKAPAAVKAQTAAKAQAAVKAPTAVKAPAKAPKMKASPKAKE